MNVPGLREELASRADNAPPGEHGKPAIRGAIPAATAVVNAAKPKRPARKIAATTRPR